MPLFLTRAFFLLVTLLKVGKTKMSDVPKNFILRCQKCRWARLSTGLSEDLKDLHEYVSCANCGKIRTFRCPKCGQTVKLIRIRNNS